MDLSTLTQSETFKFNLVAPDTGLKTDICFEVYGQDSKKYKSVLHRIKNDKVINSRRKMTSEQIDENGMELMVACVKSWDNVMEGGEQLECTPENVKRIFTDYPWIFEQVEEKALDRANFLTGASTS